MAILAIAFNRVKHRKQSSLGSHAVQTTRSSLISDRKCDASSPSAGGGAEGRARADVPRLHFTATTRFFVFWEASGRTSAHETTIQFSHGYRTFDAETSFVELLQCNRKSRASHDFTWIN